MTRVAGLVCVISLTVACGESPPAIVFDSVEIETTGPVTVPEGSAEPAASAPLPAASAVIPAPSDSTNGDWRDATGNLAGLRSECGNVNHVADRGDSLITAVSLRGAYATADGGQTWRQLGQAPDSAELTLRLTSVLTDPENPDRFWITGVYNGVGVYETLDGGESFRGLGEVYNIVSSSVDFDDPQRQLQVAVNQDIVAVARTDDGGETWLPINGDLPQQGGRTTGVLVVNSETYLVGIADGSVPGVYRTVDGGQTWQRVHAGGVAGVPLRRASGDLAWLLERGGGLITSVDDGATWSAADGRGISPFAMSLVELPNGMLATHSSSNLIVSNDAGVSWNTIGPTFPYEPTGILYSEADAAFYIWHYDCDLSGDNAVRPGTIMRLDFAAPA
jgi:photosystem II stability/assembly factor-like uncharacterized protein